MPDLPVLTGRTTPMQACREGDERPHETAVGFKVGQCGLTAQLTIRSDRPAPRGQALALCDHPWTDDKSPPRARYALVTASSVPEPRDDTISLPSAHAPHLCLKCESTADILWFLSRHDCPTQHGASSEAGPVAVAPFRTLAPKKKVVILWDCVRTLYRCTECRMPN